MKANDKGDLIPNAFAYCYTGSREEAMNRFSPVLPEGQRYSVQEFWADSPDQRWLGVAMGEEETALLVKVLAGPKERTPEEEVFCQRMMLLISASVHHHHQGE